MTVATPCSENVKCPGWIKADPPDEGELPKGWKVEDGVAYQRCKEHRHHPDDWFEDPGSGRDTAAGKARRRARDACWVDCPMKMRLLCLDQGMKSENLSHGIWGGYTEAQRQEITTAMDDRRRRQDRVQ